MLQCIYTSNAQLGTISHAQMELKIAMLNWSYTPCSNGTKNSNAQKIQWSLSSQVSFSYLYSVLLIIAGHRQMAIGRLNRAAYNGSRITCWPPTSNRNNCIWSLKVLVTPFSPITNAALGPKLLVEFCRYCRALATTHNVHVTQSCNPYCCLI